MIRVALLTILLDQSLTFIITDEMERKDQICFMEVPVGVQKYRISYCCAFSVVCVA